MNFLNTPFKEFFTLLNQEGFVLEGRDIKPDLSFTLSTVGEGGFPSSRILFLKQFFEDEFYFFTSKYSQKAQEISQNPNVSLCLFLDKTKVQIRVEGIAIESSFKITQSYFNTRSALSRAGAIASRQSQVLQNYEAFIEEVKSIAEKEENLQCPQHWASFAIRPLKFEFWKEGDFRLHTRTVYKKDLNSKNSWFKANLYP